MCGICGYIAQIEYAPSVIQEMNDVMRHRGPDDSGTYQCRLSNGSYLALGQRRLSILDLSKAGHQPMFTKDRKLAVVYNGEVYNFKELRQDLVDKGYVFQSNCDTEVLLYLYQEYGTRCFRMLNGMFAVGIVDFEQEEVTFARDRMGKKPLYYYISEDKKTFVFASELKPIIKFPEFHKEIRTELISSFLVNKNYTSPDTVFRNTYKLEPGQYIIWKNGELMFGQFWDLLKQYEKYSADQIGNYEAAKRQLRHLLLDSIEKRMVADVPVGTFLSGGIDSTLITAYAKKVQGGGIKTFTIGFYSKEQNEAEYAKAVAKYLGTEHTEFYISEKELFEQVQDLVYYFDEPFSDSSQIPTMLVSQLAKKDTTVILSGDGGDELFCGYKMYDWMLLAQKLDFIGDIGYSMCSIPFVKKWNLLERLPDKAEAFFRNRDSRYKLQLFNDIREKYASAIVLGESLPTKSIFEEKIHSASIAADNWQMQRMLLDMRNYMADEILVKTDRCSMRYSLEVRCPMLDYRIVEYSYRLSHKFKYKVGNKKRILKDLAYEVVPRQLLDRPKQGFSAPFVKWLKNELYSQLMHYADEEILKKQNIFVHGKVHELIQTALHGSCTYINDIVWGFFVFQMWYQKYIEDLW